MDYARLTSQDFQKKHRAIEDTVYAILGSIRSQSVVRARMRLLSEQIASYLSYQEDGFYTHMNKSYAGNHQALKMLEFLSNDVKYIMSRYLKFFDRFSEDKDVAVWRNFPREFSTFSRELMARFQVEKDYLFPLMDQLHMTPPEQPPAAE